MYSSGVYLETRLEGKNQKKVFSPQTVHYVSSKQKYMSLCGPMTEGFWGKNWSQN